MTDEQYTSKVQFYTLRNEIVNLNMTLVVNIIATEHEYKDFLFSKKKSYFKTRIYMYDSTILTFKLSEKTYRDLIKIYSKTEMLL